MVIIFDNSKYRPFFRDKNYIWYLTLCWPGFYARPGRRNPEKWQIMLRKIVKEMLNLEFYIDSI